MMAFSTSCSNATTIADTLRVETNIREEATQQSTLVPQRAQRNAGCEIKLRASWKRNEV